MIRRWNLPLTYPPKVEPVRDGRCTQTIRAGRKIQVGHLVSFHGWAGKPYRSQWSFGTPPRYWEVQWINDIIILKTGIIATFWGDENPGLKLAKGTYGKITLWLWPELDWLAALDFIDPPTGEELGRVLMQMHRIPDAGLPAQIIRWRYS